MEKKMPEALRGRLEGRVPGLMDARGKFAVLVPLVETERGLCLLYEVRSHTLRRQPGEICFPGGELEGDESVVVCALRETQEELGIPTVGIEKEYTLAGAGQLRTRIQAFVESLEIKHIQGGKL